MQFGPLVLANMTLGDVAPLDLIDAAAAGGFDAVTLRVVTPSPAHFLVPVTGDEAMIRAIERRVADSGIAVLDVGGVWLDPATEATTYLPAFETAARLGARFFLLGANDPDEARATDNFAQFCSLARPFGLTAALEFIAYNHTRTLGDACRIVRNAGQDNGGVLVDALHLCRSGGSPEDLRTIEPGRIVYGQICDAAAEPPPATELPDEARSRRLYPGVGALPLVEFLDALPPGIPLGVEAPCADHAKHSPIERGQLCGAATRAFLADYRSRRTKVRHAKEAI